MLFPYLNGEDLNSRPDASASRWVIDFNDRSLDDAESYPLALARVKETVKPERDRLDGRNSTANDRAKNWWKFGRRSPAMRKAIAAMPEVLVIAQVSKAVMPLRVPTRQVFDQKLVVFTTASWSDQALLSSSVHQLWAIKYSSTLESRVSYTPTDAFLTFPAVLEKADLTEVGMRLEQERRDIMDRRKIGLTKLYNLVNDPDIQRDEDIDHLREIHAELDRAVLNSYGWPDIDPGHGFHTYRQMERWTVCPTAQVEIFDRLLEESHRRAEVERQSRTCPGLSEIAREDGTFFA